MTSSSQDLARGYLLGGLGVLIFSATLPMTRLAVGSASAPALSGEFVAMGRAVIAAGLSLAYLGVVRARWPKAADWPWLALVAAGVVFGFPWFTSVAMREVAAVHASVMVGVLPLVTATVAAWLHRQRPSAGFWLCAIGGSALVVGYASLSAPAGTVPTPIRGADALLLLAMLCAAWGYAAGARLSARMPAAQVICWALVLALPLTLPLAWHYRPSHPVGTPAWAALAYVSVFSMWLGFFAWYRGLALGGTVRVSQIQLAQPFLGMLVALPLLGETLDARSLLFACGVMVLVLAAKRMPVRTLPPGNGAPSITTPAETLR